MAQIQDKDRGDLDVEAVQSALEHFEQDYPRSQAETYRYNSGSIRVRVQSEAFEGLDPAARQDFIWPYFEQMPDDVVSQLSMLVLVTSRDVSEHSFGSALQNLEFEKPTPSTF